MSSSIYLVTLSIFLVIGFIAFFALETLTSRKTVVGERLKGLKLVHAEAHPGAVIVDSSKRGEPGWFRKVSAISTALPLSPRTESHYGRMLMQAGYRSPGAVGIFFGMKVILSLGLFAVTALWLYSVTEPRFAFAGGAAGFIFGLLAPNFFLNAKLKKRQTEIFHALPDVLDLMTVCVEAGLGMDAAIIKISQEKLFSKNVLAGEFKIVSPEIRAGKARVNALRDLGERTGVEDIRSLVALLIQTDKLGASLARSLRVHSDSLRTKRRQFAEEAAAKTTIKMIFPLAMCIFPAILVVLLGPAAMRIFGAIFGHAIK